MIGYTKISRADFYARGAFSNPRLVRTVRGNSWAYFQRCD